MYLTRTNDTSGDRIATLLMLDTDGTSTYGNRTSYYGTNSFTSNYPTSMYGTSYIRAVTLNNGGPYVPITSNSSNPSSTTTASQSSSHKYAIFTVEKESEDLTDYLCKPNNVWYQKQSQGNSNESGFTLNNESLDTNITSGWYNNSTSYTYQNKTYYTQWGQDYLWLPSLSETGSSDSYKGIWELSTTERATTSSKASYFWSRSGSFSYSFNASSLNASGGSYGNSGVNYTNGVRAALHLNLDLIAQSTALIVTANANNTSYGTVSGGGTYNYGTQATLTATPNTNCDFMGWDINGDGVVDKTENPYIFTVTTDLTITAIFELIPVSITAQSNDTNCGTVVGAGFYKENEIAELLAVPKANCGFKYWIDNNNQVYYNNPLQITVENDITFTAVFTNSLFEGTAVVASEGGEVRLTGYADNTDIVHISALAYTGYVFAGWETNDNTDLSAYGMSADIPYNLIKGKVIIARFYPVSNNNTNNETSNQEEIL